MDNIKMITKYITRDVSETHDLNNPTQGTQCGDKDNLTENQRLGETRSLLRIF